MPRYVFTTYIWPLLGELQDEEDKWRILRLVYEKEKDTIRAIAGGHYHLRYHSFCREGLEDLKEVAST